MLSKLIKVSINGQVSFLKPTLSILEACKALGHTIPRFCYHELLSIAGNCRMCLVELAGGVKPVASCAMPISNNLQVFLNTPLVFKARENVLEALLINHPLDCPICDQGGECDLQDQAKKFGSWHSRFLFEKKSVENKHFSFFISTIMNRCINCTRCVRYSAEILGDEKLGTVLRGGSSEISNYSGKKLNGQIISNIVDLCPVGALTHKFYAFKGRPWEYKTIKSIDCTDSFGTALYLSYQFNNVVRVSPKFMKKVSTDGLLTDKARYFFDALSQGRLYKAYANIKFLKGFDVKQLSTFIKYECLKRGSDLAIITNDFQSFERIKMMKDAFYKYNIRIGSITKSTNRDNYFNGTRASLTSSVLEKSVRHILISVNLELEGPLVNYRLKLLSLLKNKSVSQWLGFQSNNAFNCFSIKDITFIMEGKASNCFASLLKQKLLLIFGESVVRTGLYLPQSMKALLLRVTNVAEVYVIRSTCNSNGLDMLDMKQITASELKKAKSLLAWDLCESELSLKTFTTEKRGLKYWLDTHGCNFAWKNASVLIPSKIQMEESVLLVNNDCKPQMTSKNASQKKVSSHSLSLDLKSSLSHLVSPKTVNNQLEVNFFLARQLNTKVSGYKNEKKQEVFVSSDVTIFSSYPFKNFLEDSSREGKLAAKSRVLANLSINARRLNKNFV